MRTKSVQLFILLTSKLISRSNEMKNHGETENLSNKNVIFVSTWIKNIKQLSDRWINQRIVKSQNEFKKQNPAEFNKFDDRKYGDRLDDLFLIFAIAFLTVLDKNHLWNFSRINSEIFRLIQDFITDAELFMCSNEVWVFLFF